ncbi:MAG: hypothetical protein ACI4PM_06880 [Butyricicoccus sp.]
MSQFQKIIKEIADNHHVTPEEVYQDMQRFLELSLTYSENGQAITPEQFIEMVIRKL